MDGKFKCNKFGKRITSFFSTLAWATGNMTMKGTRKCLKIAMSFEEETAATVAAKNGSIALAAEITKVTGGLAGDQNNDNGLLVEAFLKVEPEARGRAHELFGAYK